MCGCSVGKKQISLNEIDCAVTFDLSGVRVKGQLRCKNKKDMTFTVKEPENLSDVVFSLSEVYKDEVRISYPEIKVESPVYMLLSIMNDVWEKEILLPYKGNFVFDGSVDSSEYKINFNCENESIISIQTHKLTYNFE
jgi:hypothetical protein